MFGKISKLLIFIIFASFAEPNAAVANPYKSGACYGEDSRAREMVGSAKLINFKWQSYLRLDSLFGEPLIDAKIRWSLDANSSLVELPNFLHQLDRDKDESFVVSLNRFPEAELQKIALVSAVVAFRFEERGQHYFIVADMGAVGKPDGETWSFNVTGSPNWNRTVFKGDLSGPFVEKNNSGKAQPSHPLSAEKAKVVFKKMKNSELLFCGAKLLSNEISLFHLLNWYQKNSKINETASIIGSQKKVVRALYKATGLDARPFVTIPSIEDAEYYSQRRYGLINEDEAFALKSAKESFERFKSIPFELYADGDFRVFESGLSKAEREIAEARNAQTHWVNSEPNPSSFPRGSPKESGLESEIDERLSASGANRGVSGVSLIWNSTNDLDLSVNCGSKGTINFNNRLDCSGGRLDVDANSRYEVVTEVPIENIFWEKPVPSGDFEIKVNLYKRNEEGPSYDEFTVQIRTPNAIQLVTGMVSGGQKTWTYNLE